MKFGEDQNCIWSETFNLYIKFSEPSGLFYPGFSNTDKGGLVSAGKRDHSGDNWQFGCMENRRFVLQPSWVRTMSKVGTRVVDLEPIPISPERLLLAFLNGFAMWKEKHFATWTNRFHSLDKNIWLFERKIDILDKYILDLGSDWGATRWKTPGWSI